MKQRPDPRGNRRGPSPRFPLALVLAALAAPATVGAGPVESIPIPVSPGSAERFAVTGTPCPTFSWSAVAGAAGYELVVYRAPLAPHPETAGEKPVVRARIPGGALAWTPSADECLEIAGAYAWAVRAAGGDGGGEWSQSRLFRVDPEAVLGELGPVLRRAIERQLELRERRAAGERWLIAAGAGTPAGEAGPPPPRPAPERRVRYSGGRRLAPGEPPSRGVYGDDVELTLVEEGSGVSDYVQLALDSPTTTGSSAWVLAVAGVDGKLFLSGPTFTDAFQVDAADSKMHIALLELPDVVRLEPHTSGSRPLCNAATANDEGRIYYEDSTNDLCFCDGTNWRKVDGETLC